MVQTCLSALLALCLLEEPQNCARKCRPNTAVSVVGENNSNYTLWEHSGKIPGLRRPLENRNLVPALHPTCQTTRSWCFLPALGLGFLGDGGAPPASDSVFLAFSCPH